jgi:4,4'-diaponeurosporenoate glycosyltransferase
VFLDADTELPAASVDALAGHALEADGLVSVMPRHRVVRPYEQLSALPALVAAMGAGSGPVGAARWWHGPAAFGMALAIPRPVYFAAGGHAAVRAEIAEDLAFARAVDAVGAPVVAWCGTARGTVRMYGEGAAQLVRGWAKNLAAGARSLPPLRSAAIALWVAMLAQACTLLVASAVGVGATSIGVAAAVYTAFATQTAVLARRVGPFTRAVALTLPVLVVAFCAIFVASFVLSVTGRRIIWRERPVRVGVRS